MQVTAALRYEDMPALFRAADQAAVKAQAQYLAAVKGQIAFLLLGSISATVASATEVDAIALVGVAAFIIVAGLRVYQRLGHLERTWYDARLVAESVRSLTWRYAMDALPFFDAGSGGNDVDREFNARLWKTLADIDDSILPPARHEEYQITPAMRALRAAPLAERRAVYEAGRVQDQITWYADRAHRDAARSGRWDAAFLAASGIAVFFGMLQAVGWISINVLGVAGFAAALITTWTGVNRFARQARVYALAAHELLATKSLLPTVDDPTEWSAFVDQAEEVVSVEHTSWRVSRRG